jgi:predicted alpha-1,2-mannosidase
MKRLVVLLLSSFLLITLDAQYIQYVDPMIGTGGHGHTFPGATTPFAMVQLSPDTRVDNSWDGCSGYHYSDSVIYGFSHTHLSGTGCSDYGDIAFMPGYLKEYHEYENTTAVPRSFKHADEKATAGYYSVKLNTIPVTAELTSSTRVGLQQYTYAQEGWACITLNLEHRDELIEGKINIDKDNSSHFGGFRRSKAWAQDQLVYFYSEVSRKADVEYLIEVTDKNKGSVKLNLFYKVHAGEKILIKTALSTVDEEGAKRNLQAEMPGWDFNEVKKNAEDAWEQELKKIEVFDANEKNKTIFYTALYHCMIHPNVLNDVDGRYRGRDKQVHIAEGFNYYTVFSLWDTHRALHPLLNIIDKKRTQDFILTFLAQYQQSGRLPMWELWDNETDCMIGFHAVSVILDACRNGSIDINLLARVYPACKVEAMSGRFGLKTFRDKGYLSVEDGGENVSRTLEYSYDMWCMAELAQILDYKVDEDYFRKLSEGWLNVYDVKSGFMRPRKNGGWLANFDPYEVNNNYTEANAWQYSFFVPHQDDELYKYMRKPLLDSLFTADNKTTGREQSDISGLIGQYAQGNEPSHNYAYLLSNNDCQKYVKRILNTLYTDKTDGLCGNEDCGQMSAWYVMSAMGFYAACPGRDTYSFGYPIFDSVHIHIASAAGTPWKQTRIVKKFNGYYRQVLVNNKPWPLSGISYEVLQGATINFSQAEGYIIPAYLPGDMHSAEYHKSIAPLINAAKQVFRDSMAISFDSYSDELYHKLNVNEIRDKYYYYFNSDSTHLMEYKDPFYIKTSCSIHAYSVFQNIRSPWTDARYFIIPNDWRISLKTRYQPEYSAEGDDAVIDGLRGGTDWRLGHWQGYSGKDFEAVIDMKKPKEISKISASFLQDSRAWIMMPPKVEFFISDDGIHFTSAGVVVNSIADSDITVQTKEFEKEFPKTKCRYIKVKALNYGTLPAWHNGAGNPAWLFIDEVELK